MVVTKNEDKLSQKETELRQIRNSYDKQTLDRYLYHAAEAS